MSAIALALLDRDGTLNRKAPEGEWVTRPEDLELLPGAAEAVRRLNDAGIAVAIVTNQRAIAIGRLSEEGLDAIHDRLRETLDATAGARIDRIYVCPHERGACSCRKPGPGMLIEAAADVGVEPARTVMIGDADSDVEAGRRFGAGTVQLTTGASAADATAPTLLAAIEALLA